MARELVAKENVGLLGHYFAEFLAARSGLESDDKKKFYDVVCRVSSSLEQGHSCIQLQPEEVEFVRQLDLVTEQTDGVVAPCPLVVSNSNLYLHRYYVYESRLAQQIHEKSRLVIGGQARFVPGEEELEHALDLLFPPEEWEQQQKDYQREAAKRALEKSLLIISGGPGTGKTSTVVKILALLLYCRNRDLKIGLAAPTGKAAMRLSESIANSLVHLEEFENLLGASNTHRDKDIACGIPTSASTLHRLLGVQRNRPGFIHNRDNPLNWDVVVVDEASMVDLAMMSNLVDAMRPEAQLILLGDKDQLASVESGSVLSDFIHSIPGNSIELRKSYRFDSNIKQLATAINRSDAGKTWELLQDPVVSNISLLDSAPAVYGCKRYTHYMELAAEIGGSNLFELGNIKELFSVFNRFRLLCAVHFGDRGVVSINRKIEQEFAACGFECASGAWYPGRPILITKNDYSLDLYNGDIGICLPGPDGQDAVVWFERSDGSLVHIPPNRLPPCETVFAMTIHKSQGSEFAEVVVVLPKSDNRILSRELVYTGVTRAKEVVYLVAEEPVLQLTLKRDVKRYSGLRFFLSERSVS